MGLSMQKDTISLLRPKPKEDMEVPDIYENENCYPYGTTLSFEKEEIAKIPALQGVEAGATVTIYAMGQIKEVRVVDSDNDSKKRERVEIQVTDIGIVAKKRRDDMTPKEYREDREKS